MRQAELDPSALEAVLTVDGSPLYAFVAPPGASIALLERLERGGGLQAFGLGDDLERWRQSLDDNLRDSFITRDAVSVVLERSRERYDELTRLDAELDARPPPRRDFRSVLVEAVKQSRAWAPGELTAALDQAPRVETSTPSIPLYDEDPVEAEAPAIAGSIALLPVEAPHEALALLRFGGFNACPPSEIHVAVMRRWEHAFGARLAIAAPDALVLRIARPPSTRRAIHVARLEQGWLGGDERPTIAETKGRMWRWWWD